MDSETARKDREWAAKADASPGGSGAHHGAAGTPGGAAAQATTGGTGTAAGSSADAGPYRTPKHLRTSSGPRFSGRGVLAVFGILGVLLTIGIMAILAVKVLDGMSGSTTEDPSPSANPADEGGADLVVPGAPGVPLAPGVPDGAQIDPGGSTDAARAAECEVEATTIGTAAQAFELVHGSPAASVDEIVAQGYLEPVDGGFSHELGPNGEVLATGDCASG